MRILCLWLPAWPVQRHVAAQPQLADQAVALHGEPPRGSRARGRRIVACSPQAEQQGVRCGMPLAEAAAMQRRGAALHLLPHEPAEDLRALAELAEHCERFSPLVGWQTTAPEALPAAAPTGPNCLLLEVTGVASLLGGEQALAERAVEALSRRGCQVSAAVAGSVGAAWAAAHFTAAGQPAAAPRAQVIPPGQDSQALAPLPLEALRMPRASVQLLRQLGVERVGQLERLPRQGLAARLGQATTLRWDQARGAAAESIVAHVPAAPFQVEQRAEAPLHRPAAVEAVVAALAAGLAQQLAWRRQGALQLQCRLDCLDGQTLTINLELFEATAAAEHLQQLLHLQLELLRLPDAVERVVLKAARTAALQCRQGELFAEHRYDPQQLAQLIDRLRGRLGQQNVAPPRLRADAQPERAWTPGPPADTPHSPTDSSSAPAPLQRPLLLLSQPQLLPVTAVSDGPPARFPWRSQLAEVVRHWGPERIETGWWRGRSVRRDYYRVEIQTGERLWLFRQLDDGRWRLHGHYA